VLAISLSCGVSDQSYADSTQASGTCRRSKQSPALVADIYERRRSIRRCDWARSEKMCAFVPAAVANIFIPDGVPSVPNIGTASGWKSAWNELYLTKYVKLKSGISGAVVL